MSDYQIYGPEHFVKSPWKNGLGHTTELLRQDIDSDVFAWRLSIARVTQDGPFSNFDGYQRSLILLNGNGITLEHGDGSRQVLGARLDTAHFAGKGPTTASLHQGPIEDFNIMTHIGLCSAQVHTGVETSEFTQATAADLLLIYASTEMLSVRLHGSGPAQVPVGHLLRLEITRPGPLHISGSAYIAVEIFNNSNKVTGKN